MNKEELYLLFINNIVDGYSKIEERLVHRAKNFSVYEMVYIDGKKYYMTTITTPNSLYIGGTEFTDPVEVQQVEIKKMSWRPVRS